MPGQLRRSRFLIQISFAKVHSIVEGWRLNLFAAAEGETTTAGGGGWARKGSARTPPCGGQAGATGVRADARPQRIARSRGLHRCGSRLERAGRCSPGEDDSGS